MTAATLTHLPLAAGGAVLASSGRALGWAVSRYMRAPLANTAVLAMVGMTAMAASNALYLQQHAHPAPLFAPVVQEVAVAAPAVQVSAPVVPAVRPERQQIVSPLPTEVTTGSVARDVEAVIGNAEVFELQRKLALMELFDGEVDGYYGPQTAGAIRKFEARMGLPSTGELNPEILEAVRQAPAFAAPEVRGPVQQTLGLLAAPPPLDVGVSASTNTPLATPKPLAIQPAAAPRTTGETQVRHRELPETPQEALNIAVETAGDAIDTIIQGVHTLTSDGPVAAAPTTTRQQAPAVRAQMVQTGASMAPVREPTARVASLEDTAPTTSAEVPVLDTDARPQDLMPPFSVTDPVVVARVQRGLASLGFLHGPADGVAGEATAKAIRNFEVYFNYDVTGRISPELLDLLVKSGASI